MVIYDITLLKTLLKYKILNFHLKNHLIGFYSKSVLDLKFCRVTGYINENYDIWE